MTVTIAIERAESLINLIDVMSKRGAIEGHEMLAIGVLRQDLAMAIEAAKKAQSGDQQ